MRLSSKRLAKKFTPKRALRAVPLRLIRLARRKPQLNFFPLRRPHKVYGRIGNLEVRLARSSADIRRAQKLRYEVFYEEMAAVPKMTNLMFRRDEDRYDAICDHLLVVDTGLARPEKRTWPKRPKVVGTYRVLRQSVAEATEGFYTQSEYDIAPLVERKRHAYDFMELGRSCVLKPYRNRRTVELLWQGIWTYVREQGVDVMLGCASFPGIDPKAHAMALSFLHHYSRAPEDWRVSAHPHLFVDMNMLPKDQVDPRAALRAMPPLIKGYLRLGAFVGDGAVVDRQFGTTDVFIILPVEAIDARYFGHFGAPDEVPVLAPGSSDTLN